jgi:hypothetical protein
VRKQLVHNGTPLAYTQVRIIGVSSSTIYTAWTDANGYYDVLIPSTTTYQFNLHIQHQNKLIVHESDFTYNTYSNVQTFDAYKIYEVQVIRER